MNNYCIYAHIAPNGNVYIGQTKQRLTSRWGKDGACYLKKTKGYYHTPIIAKAILKYGWDNMQHKVLFTNLSQLEADMIEEDLIYYYQKEGRSYNIQKGGANKKKPAAKIYQFTKDGNFVREWDSRQEAATYYKCNKSSLSEVLDSTHLSCKGFVWRRQKIFGEFAPTIIDYHTNAYKGIASQIAKLPGIEQRTLNGELITQYPTASAAAKAMGYKGRSQLIQCCKGLRDSWLGYKWNYYNKS